MSMKFTALVKREEWLDARTGNKSFHASLSLLNEAGEQYGPARYFSGYEELGKLLKREASVTHQQLKDFYPVYQRGQTVQLRLTLESDEAIKHLGFDPKTE